MSCRACAVLRGGAARRLELADQDRQAVEIAALLQTSGSLPCRSKFCPAMPVTRTSGTKCKCTRKIGAEIVSAVPFRSLSPR